MSEMLDVINIDLEGYNKTYKQYCENLTKAIEEESERIMKRLVPNYRQDTEKQDIYQEIKESIKIDLLRKNHLIP